MKTNNQILSDLCLKSKELERLIKAFDLSVEKCGNYKNNPAQKMKPVKHAFARL